MKSEKQKMSIGDVRYNQKKTCFYNMNDSFPLEKIDGWNPNWNRNPRYTKKHLSMEDTQKIIKHFSNKKNRISFYIRETKKLYS